MENIHDDGDPLLDAARLGIEVEHFTKDRTGGLALVELAMADLNEGLLALLREEDIESPEARKAHMKARTAHAVIGYIKQCIATGRQAEAQIREEEDDDGTEE